MSRTINQNTEPLFIFDMPDDETLSQTISVKGEKGDWGGATKTSELINDSDFTTNAALNTGLAAKADSTTVQSLSTQVSANTSAIASLNLKNIAIQETRINDNAWWYKIATLMPIDDLCNSGSIRIHGKINGVASNRPVLVDVTIMNRNAGVKAIGSVQATSDWENADFVVYQDDSTTEATLYLKLVGWNTCDFDISYIDCAYDYDGTHAATEPSGTLVWSLKDDDSLQQNIGGVINASVTGDAATVNGFNVYKTVPSTAKFTDTVYDDTSIRADIELKANTSDVASTYATKSEVAGLANGSPLVASSVSGMTDTTRIYVNTTDGYWYYYNGSSWAQGGVYQSSGLEDGSVTPVKTSFSKISRNLYDWESAPVINANLSSVYDTVQGSTKTRSTYIACDPNTTYTVSKVSSARICLATTEITPAVGVTISGLVHNEQGATSLSITTGSAAAYIVIYYYHSTHDTTVTEEDIRKTIMVEKSATAGSFVDHTIIEVKTDNLNDACVTKEKLASDVIGAISQTDRLRSRNKIYGVQFDITATSTSCTRIADAEGLKTDYVVGSTYQLNGGVNDFDNVFPWCDMRRCNLSFTADGKKVITYEGESGFALDGSNGNVMVEIPKFYSMRERIGNMEIWAITGEPKSGFNVEPAFVVDGVEQDFVYVGAYDAADLLDGAYYSYSGTYPLTRKTLSQFITDFSAVGLQSYDFSTFLMLQKLMIIEFADRDVQQYMGGISYLPYWYRGDTQDKIDSVGTNYVMVTTSGNESKERFSALWVGESIKFSTDDMGESDTTYVREITALETIGDQLKVTYSGSDLSSVFVAGDNVSGCPQKNGWTDSLIYHTGRANFASSSAYGNHVSPMRYRYIENIYGNVWELMAGLRVKNLKYYYSFTPNYNASAPDGNDWRGIGYDAPLQDQYGENGAGYIVKQGYDVNARAINLPLIVGSSNGGAANKYFADAFYSRNASASTEYISCVGGGWDHNKMAGISCLRCWITPSSTSLLQGNRPIYRG